MGGTPHGPKDWEWFHPEVVGPAPAPRTGHMACLLADGKTIVVQGGWDPRDASSDETKASGWGDRGDDDGGGDDDAGGAAWEADQSMFPTCMQVFEDAFLLDTEQWEWTPVSPARAQQLQQQQGQEDEQEAAAAAGPGLVEGGPLHPSPGFLVGHTAVLAGGGTGEEGGRREKEQERVLVFGGQDRLGVRREEVLALKP